MSKERKTMDEITIEYLITQGKDPSAFLTRSIRRSLAWKVNEEQLEDGWTNSHIYTDSINRIHTIYFEPSTPPIVYQHEYAHAYLAETAHPFFSSMNLAPGIEIRYQNKAMYIFNTLNTAADWYANGYLESVFPEEFRRDYCAPRLEDVYPMLPCSKASLGTRDTLICALYLATADKYGIPIDGKTPVNSEEVTKCKDSYLYYKPQEPKVDNLLALINSLLAVFEMRLIAQLQSDMIDFKEI